MEMKLHKGAITAVPRERSRDHNINLIRIRVLEQPLPITAGTEYFYFWIVIS